jgi:hypothetical protein
MTENDSEKTSNNVVVIKPQQEFEVISDSKRTMDEIFHSQHTSYSVLTRSNPKTLDLNEGKSHVIIANDCLLSKIYLPGCTPTKRYFFKGNGCNWMSSTLKDDVHIFDVNARKKGGIFDSYIEFINKCNNPKNKKSHLMSRKYLDCSKIKRLEILFPDVVTMEKEIILEGLFRKNDDEWEFGTRKYQLFTREIELSLSTVVRDIEFYGKGTFNMHIRIDGESYGPFDSEECITGHIIKFKFKNWDSTRGTMNKYLSDEMNQSTINAARTSIRISANVEHLDMTILYYSICDTNTCHKIFV